MAVLDQQLNRKGVQHFVTLNEDDQYGHESCLISHPNGNTYCFYSRYDRVEDRYLLCVKYSSDLGDTWSNETVLTSGFNDINPRGVVLDDQSTTSAIGIICKRLETNRLHRFTVNVPSLTLGSPIDQVGTISASSFDVVKGDNGFFYLFYLNTSQSTNVSRLRNTVGFTSNSWSYVDYTDLGSDVIKFRIKKLKNNHFAIVGSFLDGSNGSSSPSIRFSKASFYKGKLAVSFTSDYGDNWSTLQDLKTYPSTLTLSNDSIWSVLDADLTELPNGEIVVCYQEGKSFRSVSNLTTPESIEDFDTVAYNENLNQLITSDDYQGIQVVRLNSNSIQAITTTTSPPLWSNRVRTISVSPNGRYVAVGTFDGGLTVFDTHNDQNTSNWTKQVELRTTSLPPLDDDEVNQFAFLDNTHLMVLSGFYSSTSKGVEVVDITGPSVEEVYLPTTSFGTNGIVEQIGVYDGKFVVMARDAIGLFEWDSVSSRWEPTSTFLPKHGADFNSFSVVEDELIIVEEVYSDNKIHFLNKSLSLISTFSSGLASLKCKNRLGNHHLLLNGNDDYGYLIKKGLRNFQGHTGSPFDHNSTFPLEIRAISFNPVVQTTSKLVVAANRTFLQIHNTESRGRIRYAYYNYDSYNKQLTGSPDFYDVVNTLKVDSYDHIAAPNIEAQEDFSFIVSGLHVDVNEAKNVLVGKVQPDRRLLDAQARIEAEINQFLDTRAIIQNSRLFGLEMKAYLYYFSCINLKARIVPVVEQVLQAGAKIYNFQNVSLHLDFDVSSVGQTERFFGTFTAGKGSYRVRNLEARAYIQQKQNTSATGLYIVISDSPEKPNFGQTNSMKRVLSMRASLA